MHASASLLLHDTIPEHTLVLCSQNLMSNPAPTCVNVHQICAASVDGNLRTFDIRKGEMKTDCVYHAVPCVCFSKDGNCLLATCMDSKVCAPCGIFLFFVCVWKHESMEREVEGLPLNQAQHLCTAVSIERPFSMLNRVSVLMCMLQTRHAASLQRPMPV
jgi:hypothetical protein